MAKHVWRIKKEYFRQLKSGIKRIEARVGYPHIKKVHQGDNVVFENYGQDEFLVIRVTRYPNFEEMLRAEGADAVIPGTTFNEALSILRDIYPADRERLGVYAFEMRLVVEGEDVKPQFKYFSASDLFREHKGKVFTKVVAESYMITAWIAKDYPDHFVHFYGKYVPGILAGEREIIACYEDGKIRGTIILKKDTEECKISTLYVDPNYRGKGIASGLLDKSFAWLGTTKPVITIADYKLNQFAGVIKKYGWEETRILEAGFYNDHSREHVFNE